MSSSRALLLAVLAVSMAEAVSEAEVPRSGRGPSASTPDPVDQPVISVGIGLGGFVGATLRDAADPGVAWNVRASMGSPEHVRVELVYLGSLQALAGSEMAGARLVGHGIQGVLRVNIAPNPAFEPFFFLGGGWSRFHVDGAAGGALRTPDHVLEIPFGFGVARRFHRFVLDARLGLSVTSAEDLVPRESRGSSNAENMHRVGLGLGFGLAL